MRRLVVLVLMLGSLGSPGAAAAAADGPWGWPVAGAREVGRPFAPPASRYSAGHRGVDLPAPAGTAVRAAGAGRVSYAGLLAGRGVVVVVHGTLRTTY
ncbi:MAG: M23 family peptidase, partial [Frankiales bacterium]|nr:M23 family peptidase [Frankiales bacterium]